MLVLLRMFQTFFFPFILFFFAILCSVIRKVLSQLSVPLVVGVCGANRVSDRRSLRSGTGPSTPNSSALKTFAVEPVSQSVLKANERSFPSFSTSNTKFVLPPRDAVLEVTGGRWCCSPPKVNQIVLNFL